MKLNKFLKNKKGDMGISALIIFITIIMVVAIIIAVLIETTDLLQQTTKLSADESKKMISTHVQNVRITLEKDQDEEFKLIQHTIKLVPGSDVIRFEDMIIMIQLDNDTTTLSYQGPDGKAIKGSGGYYTQNRESIGPLGLPNETETDDITTSTWHTFNYLDFDLDGNPDAVRLCSDTADYCDARYKTGRYLAINLTSSEDIKYARLPVNFCNGQTTSFDKEQIPIENIGYLSIEGTSDGSCTIRASDTAITYHIRPTRMKYDWDLDGNTKDYIWINTTHVHLAFSNGTTIALNLGLGPLGLSSPPSTINVEETFQTKDQRNFTIRIRGTTNTQNVIDQGITFTIEPDSYGKYITRYQKASERTRIGNLEERDIVTLFYETPRPITHNDRIIISLIPRNSQPLRLTTSTKDTLSEEVVTLFP